MIMNLMIGSRISRISTQRSTSFSSNFAGRTLRPLLTGDLPGAVAACLRIWVSERAMPCSARTRSAP